MGDGTTETILGADPDPSHTYSSAGTHTVKIAGIFPQLYLNDHDDAPKLQSVEQWGNIQWESMDSAFEAALNLSITASDTPHLSNVGSMHEMFAAAPFNHDISDWNVSNVKDMSDMFRGASNFNQDLNGWDVSSVTDMSGMFKYTDSFNGEINQWDVSNVTTMRRMFASSVFDETAFNQDIGEWDVSSVTDMSRMFERARVFNRDISGWDVSNVTNMSRMFERASAFNQDLSEWDVSSVTNMSRMFDNADSFNGNLSGWDVSNVTDMSEMFFDTPFFNQDISGWDVSNVTDMDDMFRDARSFDQDLSGWDVSNVTTFDGFLQGVPLSLSKYDALLVRWSQLDLENDVTFIAGGNRYTPVGESARQSIIDDHNWTITDGGKSEEMSISIERSFSEATASTGYHLVALPGQVDRPIEDVISGKSDLDWQAFRDDGTESNFFVEFDGSDTFRFRPGNGFWLTAMSNWTVKDTLSRVAVNGNLNAVVGIQEGWNVISNPLSKDRPWSQVQAAHPEKLQPLWTFDGAFAQADTFRSARDGVAYYFFNDRADRDSLVIPYISGTSGSKERIAASESRPAPMLALTASKENGDDNPGSTVRVGIDPDAGGGRDAGDLVAPPVRFEEASLRIKAPGEHSSKRSRFLMAERRPPSEEKGHTFPLRLTSDGAGPVEIVARNLSAVNGRTVALLHPSAGTSYDLRRQETVTIEPNDTSTELRLAVGSEGYVDDRREGVRPTDVELSSYPNPIRTDGTVEFALPKPAEVTLRVYDVLGRRVATLAEGTKTAGRHTVGLPTDNLSSGVYIGRLRADGKTRTVKMTVVR